MFVNVHYVSVRLHFLYFYSDFVLFNFTVCKIITYISVCKVSENFHSFCMFKASTVKPAETSILLSRREALQLEVSLGSFRTINFNTNAACPEKCVDHLCSPHILATALWLCVRFSLNGSSCILVMVLVLFFCK
jgi:hypothetical protein